MKKDLPTDRFYKSVNIKTKRKKIQHSTIDENEDDAAAESDFEDET